MKVETARAIVEASKEFGGLNDDYLELDEAYCPNMGKPTAAVIGPLAWLIPAVAAAARDNGDEFVEDLGRLHFYNATPTNVIVY
jgi:hypothetical protein